jgi:hypothetical protein
MNTKQTFPCKWIAALGALQLALGLCQAQTKVLVNAFDNSDEVTSNNGQAWQNWFGTAFYQVLWDSSDASNNVNSGSVQIQAYFPDSGIGGCCGPQFLAMDGYSGINPPLAGNGGDPSSALATNVEFDVRFDASSVYNTNAANWPTIEVGTRGTGYNQYDFGTFTLPANNTSWTHVVVPIGPSANWTTIPNVFFKAYSTTLNGWLKFNVDNIQFTTAAVPVVPPTVVAEKAKEALRFFSGPNQYSRSQLVAVDTNQSWVGGSYPVSYSFNISAYDINPPINEFHAFWTPINYIQGGAISQFTDYSSASNNFRLLIVGGAANTPTVTAQLDWKTNIINANPDQLAVRITNATATGTWTVRFDSATTGVLIAPGATPAAFSLPSGVAATFANPLAFFIGLQPDPTTAIGQHLDLTRIQTSGVASPGVALNSDFTTASELDTNVWSLGATAATTWMVKVADPTAWWVSWSYPDYGTVLATRPSLLSAVPWKTPAYYSGYDTNLFTQTLGSKNWSLLPAAALPTVDGSSNGVRSSSAFFRAQNPAPAQ